MSEQPAQRWGPAYRGEPEDEEDFDRELDEILSELRVLLPGVAVLFAFLLTVPFSSLFPRLGELDRRMYFVAFVSSALALVLLTGEGAYHRLCGKPYDKRRLIRIATAESVAAIVCLAVSLAAVVFLVADLVFPGVVTAVATTGVVLLAGVVWFGSRWPTVGGAAEGAPDGRAAVPYPAVLAPCGTPAGRRRLATMTIAPTASSPAAPARTGAMLEPPESDGDVPAPAAEALAGATGNECRIWVSSGMASGRPGMLAERRLTVHSPGAAGTAAR